jgi:DNA-binding transcriptional LysR family regulator
VSLDQLSYFVAVAEEQNIGRAARRLHICQPPLSRQIRSLEQELGTPLFRRTPRGVELLPAAQRLLPRARQILEAVASVRHLAHEDAPATQDLAAADAPITAATSAPGAAAATLARRRRSAR